MKNKKIFEAEVEEPKVKSNQVLVNPKSGLKHTNNLEESKIK
jgi:hypothetical protein